MVEVCEELVGRRSLVEEGISMGLRGEMAGESVPGERQVLADDFPT